MQKKTVCFCNLLFLEKEKQLEHVRGTCATSSAGKLRCVVCIYCRINAAVCRDVKKAGISDQIPTMHTNNMKYVAVAFSISRNCYYS